PAVLWEGGGPGRPQVSPAAPPTPNCIGPAAPKGLVSACTPGAVDWLTRPRCSGNQAVSPEQARCTSSCTPDSGRHREHPSGSLDTSMLPGDTDTMWKRRTE